MKKQFLSINGVLVNKDITEVRFACDLGKCKGACCTLESEFGAPLKAGELDEITKALPAALPYIPDEHRKIIDTLGFFEQKQGELLTRSYKQRACVLVYYDNGVAKCALERAYFEGKTSFRKPVSCHLFPIRIADFGGDILRYEKIHECDPAVENGKTEGSTIAEFCKDALERNYGSEWYAKLQESSK